MRRGAAAYPALAVGRVPPWLVVILGPSVTAQLGASAR